MNNQARHLRVWRAERDVTQSWLRKRAQSFLPTGISIRSTRYHQIEHGKGREPSEIEKRAIAKALAVKVADIAWDTPRLEKAS